MEIDYNVEFEKLYDNSDKKDDNELYEKGKVFQKSIRYLDVDNQTNLFYFLAFYASKLGNEKEAIEYCDNGIEIIYKEKARTTTILRELYFQKGISLSRLADNDESLFLEAEKAFDEYVRLFINEASGGVGIRGDFYSFRTINLYTLQDLINGEITVSNPTTFNDPFDCLFYQYIDKKVAGSFNNRALKKSFEKIRIRSFISEVFINPNPLKSRKRKIKPFKDVLMWSHYADSHKGICLKYDTRYGLPKYDAKSESNFFEVKYFKGNKVDIINKPSINFKTGFLMKNKCWKYEGEVRLLHFDPKCDADFIHLPLGDAKVSAIYFGLYCPPEHVDMVKKIFENTDVKFYEMKTDPTNIYNLIPEECSR